MHTRTWFLLLAIVVAPGAVGPAHAQGLRLIAGVEEIATDTIGDLAVASVDAEVPAIYYNPRMVRRYGPLITRFFIAHEFGHIQYHHTRIGIRDLPEATRDSILRSQELAADCYAASLDGPEARQATEAALRFFARLGPFRFDNEHPTGAQRAARVLMCLPGPRPALAAMRGETGVEMGPVSAEAEAVRFAVAAPPLGASGYGGEAEVWLNGRRLGTLSNMRFPQQLSVENLTAGLYSYRITLDVYNPEGAQQYVPSGTVTGLGHVAVRDGDRFRIAWTPGEDPRLVPDQR